MVRKRDKRKMRLNREDFRRWGAEGGSKGRRKTPDQCDRCASFLRLDGTCPRCREPDKE